TAAFIPGGKPHGLGARHLGSKPHRHDSLRGALAMITGLSPTNQQILDSINNSQADLNRAQRQVSSGLRISRASDDPQVVSNLFQVRSDLAQVTQVANNMAAVKGEVDTADAGLQNGVQL